jgi:adenine-specific DNA-methyltransferase
MSGASSIDLGFRVFALDASNIQAWTPDPEDLNGTLLRHAEHLTPGRTEQDVLYELLIKLGLDLAVPMESRQIAGKTVHSIGAGALMACLSDAIDRDVAEPLALGIAAWQKAQAQALQGEDDNAKPVSTKLVFKDSAFADDVAKTNLAAILSQHGLDDVRSI